MFDFSGAAVGADQAALVCSDHGLSRSVSVILAYLMVFYKWSLKVTPWNISPLFSCASLKNLKHSMGHNNWDVVTDLTVYTQLSLFTLK